MKKFSFILTFILLSRLGTFAQSEVQDSVKLGPQYQNDVWYSLKNGVVAQAPKDNWDIAFQCFLFSAGVRANDNNGVAVFKAGTDTTKWATLDTTGNLTEQNRLYNSDTSWSYGAFNANRNPNNLFDEGWGVYDQGTHLVNGDELFFVRLKNGSVKKLWIKSLDPVVKKYYVKYGDLTEQTGQLMAFDRGTFPEKMYGYFSFANNSAVNREPDIKTWDLLFTKYVDNTIHYTVTGVLQNTIVSNQSNGAPIGVTVAKAYPVGQSTENFSAYPFKTHINTIGYDWKTFDQQQMKYIIEDSVVYFVKDNPGNIWKLVFTGYKSAETQSNFSKKLLQPAGIDENLKNDLGVWALYPNPAAGQTTVVFETLKKIPMVQIWITDLTGKKVQNIEYSPQTGLNAVTVETSDLPSGVYLVNLVIENKTARHKLVVR